MAIDYKVTSALVFDDVRFEQSGKEILIGVYDNLLVPQLPFTTSLMCFRVSVRLARLPDADLNSAFRLVDPMGADLFSVTGIVQVADLAFSTGVRRAPINFQHAGLYRLFFALNREPEEVYQFEVRLQSEDQTVLT